MVKILSQSDKRLQRKRRKFCVDRQMDPNAIPSPLAREISVGQYGAISPCWGLPVRSRVSALCSISHSAVLPAPSGTARPGVSATGPGFSADSNGGLSYLSTSRLAHGSQCVSTAMIRLELWTTSGTMDNVWNYGTTAG